mgnify:CR=1 FL=1
MMKKQKQNKKEVEMKVTKFYFWNQGKSYTMLVTAPDDVPQYRLKEIVDRNFVGKKEPVTFNPMLFSQYKATYTVS